MTEFGLDEGAIFQALATPVIDHTVTKQRTTKKGKVITETTHYQVTGAQLLALYLGLPFFTLMATGDPAKAAEWHPGQNWFERLTGAGTPYEASSGWFRSLTGSDTPYKWLTK